MRVSRIHLKKNLTVVLLILLTCINTHYVTIPLHIFVSVILKEMPSSHISRSGLSTVYQKSPPRNRVIHLVVVVNSLRVEVDILEYVVDENGQDEK